MEWHSKSRGNNLIALLILALLSSGCEMESLQIAKHSMTLLYDIDANGITKTAQSPTDDVDNINLFIYNSDGSLADSNYSNSANIDLSFHKGRKYSIYAIANVGDITSNKAFSHEEGLVEYRHSIKNPISILLGDEKVPMTYQSSTPLALKEDEALTIRLKRCTALINIKADLSKLEDVKKFEIESISLMNIPKTISLFSKSKINSDESPLEESCTISGDKLLNINRTGASFMAFENMQGNLLEENNSQSGKVFSESSPYRKLCTYIEMKVNYRSSTLFGDSLIYRFYPGLDNYSNFDIERNRTYNMTITPTNTGIDEESWRVDVSNLKPTVLPVSISLPSDFFTYEGYSKAIKAEITPIEAEYQELKWEMLSENNNAAIDQNGIISGICRGTAIVKVSCINHPHISAIQKIIVKPAVSIIPTPYFELTNYALWPEKTDSHYPSSAQLHIEKAPNADIQWIIVRYGGQRDDISVTQDGKITLKAKASGHYTIQAKASTGDYYSDYACADIYYYLMYQDVMRIIGGDDRHDGTCDVKVSMWTKWYKGRNPSGTFREMLYKRIIIDSRDTSFSTKSIGGYYINDEVFKGIPFFVDLKHSAYKALSPFSFAFETKGNFGEGATFRYDTGDWNYYYVKKEGSFYNAPAL